MSFTVTAWNAEKLLTDVSGASPDQAGEQTLFEGLRELEQSDVIALSEAFVTSVKSSSGLVDDVVGHVEQFANNYGYRLWHTPYDDANKQRPNAPAEYDHHMLLLGRPGVVSATVVRLATRNAFAMRISDPDADQIRGFAVHFDDRTKALRSHMTRSLLSKLDLSVPTFVAGDLNSMDRQSRMARVLRSQSVGRLANHIPNPRAKNIATRLIEMSEGEALTLLHAAKLQDAAPDFRSTVHHHGIPYGQLDHIMVRDLQVKGFRQQQLAGSDHAALSAKLQPVL